MSQVKAPVVPAETFRTERVSLDARLEHLRFTQSLKSMRANFLCYETLASQAVSQNKILRAEKAELVEALQMMHDNFGPKTGTLGHAYQRGFSGDGRTPTIGPANGSAADQMFQIGKRVGAILAKLSGGAASNTTEEPK